MAEENKILVRRWFDEVLTHGNLRWVDELFAPNYVLHDPGIPQEIHGREGLKRYMATYHAAYPSVCFAVEDQMAERDMVVTRWSACGVHRGEFLGLPPTGSWVTMSGIEFDRIVGGQIDEAWVSYHLSTDSALDSERLQRALATMQQAFPDLRIDQADSITEGNKTAFRWMMSGTHEGEFMSVAPTGRLVSVMGMDIVRTMDGEILEYWGEFDVMGMLRQLGVVP